MENIKLKFGSYLVVTVFLTFGLSLSLQSLLAAWQAPSDLPPLSNINPPIFDVSPEPTFHATGKPLGVTGNLTVNGNQFVTGNVGIGTTSPAAKLEVSSGTHTTRFSGNSILFSRSDGPAYIYANSEGGYLAFGTNGRSTSASNSNLVLSTDQSSYFNGNVGIGDTSPTAKLEIGGTAGVDGIRFPDGTLQTTAASASDCVETCATSYPTAWADQQRKGPNTICQYSGYYIACKTTAAYIMHGYPGTNWDIYCNVAGNCWVANPGGSWHNASIVGYCNRCSGVEKAETP